MLTFSVKLNNNHVITLEKDRVGNVLIKVLDENTLTPLAYTVESGDDFKKMSSILCD